MQQSDSSSPRGILAIWNDCAPGREAVYERWYRTEHLAERLAVPGFRTGRRFRRLADTGPEFFTCYETRSPDVLYSEAYRNRVDNPSELTREVMAGVFVNVSRTICRVVSTSGEMRGGFVVTATASDSKVLEAIARENPARGDVVRTEIWSADARPEEGNSAEQLIRGPDGHITGCALIETASAGSAAALARSIGQQHDCPAHAYGLMYELVR